MSESIDTEAIRARAQRLHATSAGAALTVAEDARTAADEIDVLRRERDMHERRADLHMHERENAELRASRGWDEACRQEARALAAEAKLAAVEAVRQTMRDSPAGNVRAWAEINLAQALGRNG